MPALLFILSPCIIAALFSIRLFLTRQRDKGTSILLWIGVLTSAYFFADAIYLSNLSSYRNIVFSDMVCQAIVPSLPIFIVMYLRCIRNLKPCPRWMYLFFIPAIAILCMQALVCVKLGIDNIADYYEQTDLLKGTGIEANKIFSDILFIAWYLYIFVVATELLSLLFYIGHILYSQKAGLGSYIRWYTKGKRNSLLVVQCFNFAILVLVELPQLFFYREFVLNIQIVFVILSLIQAGILIIVFQAHRSGVNKKVTLAGSFASTVKDIEKTEAAGAAPVESKKAEDRIHAEFCKFMNDEEGFRTHGITITDVATKLHSNRTYLSVYINNTFGQTFPEYINNRRIEFAKKYIDEHPGEKQEVIADLCGYDSVSTFNNKFKIHTGLTPGQWSSRTR